MVRCAKLAQQADGIAIADGVLLGIWFVWAFGSFGHLVRSFGLACSAGFGFGFGLARFGLGLIRFAWFGSLGTVLG
jgi:hypothetical protein